jgi:hypothetical protein
MFNDDLHGADDDLVTFAAAAANQLHDKFEHEPEAEFVAWLEVALEREAMVGVTYEPAHLKKHLNRLKALGVNANVIERLRRTIGDVWAQEKGHTAYIKSILDVIKVPDGFWERVRRQGVEVFGALQGAVAARLVAEDAHDRLLAVAALSLGKRITQTPPFIDELRALAFPPFCALNGALEETAVAGYQRMRDLADMIRVQQILDGTTVDIELNRIISDERYHEAVFRGFSNWEIIGRHPPPTPQPGAPLSNPSFTVEAHAAVCQEARARAYGTGAASERATEVMTVDLNGLEADPLIQYLRGYVQEFADAPRRREEIAGV